MTTKLLHYTRTITKIEAENGVIFISREAYLKEFPKHYSFMLKYRGKSTQTNLKASPCIHEDIRHPHLHYYLHLKKPFGLKPGDEIRIEHKEGTKSYIMKKVSR